MAKNSDQILGRIQMLIETGEHLKAYHLCVELLKVNPENGKAARIMNELEGKIQKQHIMEIKEQIRALDPLWEQGKYPELVQRIHDLYELAPNYGPIEELMIKAETKYKEQIEKQKRKFLEDYEAELEKLFDEDKYEDLVFKTAKTLAAYPSNERLKELGIKMRTKMVKAELEKNKPLLGSSDYVGIVKFLNKLKTIEPSYEKLDKLLIKYKKKGLTNLSDKQQEFVYRGLSHAETLLQLKKYEAAAIISAEVLEIDPLNKKAKAVYEEASRKADKQIQKETVQKIKDEYAQLKREYKADSELFIRV
ncbi:MAG: hypothetical protein ABH856_00755 [Patescibacteria group bacterium]|nr:hypothetical protein [Patescibacteria group bacterium]